MGKTGCVASHPQKQPPHLIPTAATPVNFSPSPACQGSVKRAVLFIFRRAHQLNPPQP